MGWRNFGSKRWLGLLWATVLLASCGAVSRKNPSNTGVGGETSAAGASTGDAGEPAVVAACKPDVALAKARVWRLTDSQYVSAVRQLFGVTVGPEITQSDPSSEFTNVSERTVVDSATAASYRTSAQQVAAQAVESHYESFMPCGDGEDCAEQLIRNRIARAFGRRLDESEVARYLKLFQRGAARSPQDGVRLLIEATLQSPSFLYRSELGPPTPGGPQGKVSLTPHEIATLLALSLTNALPDDQLWDKAETGALADPDVLAAEVARLLELDETHEHWGNLGSSWFGFQRVKQAVRDAADFPAWSEDVRASLFESGRLFARELLTSGSVNDIVTSRRMYLNESLAKIYGVAGVKGDELRAVAIDSPERGLGVLSQPALYAAWSRPDQNGIVGRGLLVDGAVVCGPLVPPPPPTVPPVEPAMGDEREQAEFRAQEPSCNDCHRRIDPLGLLSERYDAIGQYRATDETGTIDQSAVLEGFGSDLDGTIEGVEGLSQKLTQGRRLSDCAALNLASLTLGRSGIGEEGSCAFEEIKEDLATSGQLSDFFEALVTSPAFIQRDPE